MFLVLQRLDDFCRAHPNLENLHFEVDDYGPSLELKGDWMLNKLKTLVYNCSFPKKGNEPFFMSFHLLPLVILIVFFPRCFRDIYSRLS